jgi:hypothetical protein
MLGLHSVKDFIDFALGKNLYPSEPPELVAMLNLIDMEISEQADYVREEEALAAAQRGDLRPLVNLIRPWGAEINPIVKFLNPPTWQIISEFLTGERNLKTGRRRGEPGRPVQSVEQRRAQNPVHRAADEARVIIAILKRHYPNRSRDDVEYLAAKIAAERNGAQLRPLLRHLGRAASDPRRIS